MPPKLGEYFRAIKPQLETKRDSLEARKLELENQIHTLQAEAEDINARIKALSSLFSSAVSISELEIPVSNNTPVSLDDFAHQALQRRLDEDKHPFEDSEETVIVQFRQALKREGIDPAEKIQVNLPAEEIGRHTRQEEHLAGYESSPKSA